MIPPAYPPELASGLWVFLEQEEGRIESVALELLGKGRELADRRRLPLTGLLLGDNLEQAVLQAKAHGADRVLAAHSPHLEPFRADAYTSAAAQLILDHKPETLLLGATPYGRDLAGRLAVRLRTGLIADCTGLDWEPKTGLLLGQVTGFGGGVMASIKCPHHRPQVATVRPGIFRSVPEAGRGGEIEFVPISLQVSDMRTEVLERVRHHAPDITGAEVLVVGGRGVEGDFRPLRELATLLGGQVGASRVACDLGWIDRHCQVGQTGSAVRPKLALVCGVSGATQFTVGIKSSGYVVAVNSDPEAPIFEEADLCIVDDLFPIVEGLIAELRGGAR